MQTIINNILRNQDVNLNRGDVFDLINKGIAKHNFENFHIEKSQSYNNNQYCYNEDIFQELN